MLFRVLEAFDFSLPDGIKVIFANTGKEVEETLQFVDECSRQWGVDIVWLERRVRANEGEGNKYIYETLQVDFSTASRKGEPFESLIRARQYLPNPVARFCTAELKIRAIQDYMKRDHESWVEAVGIRYDEPRRVAKMRNEKRVVLPLVADRVAVGDISQFWKNQPFDLRLPNDNGVTPYGNCDLCFLKGLGKKLSIIENRPGVEVWWSEQERQIGGRFRKDEPGYSDLGIIARSNHGLDMEGGDMSCFCGD
ncbi:MAG: Nin-like protein [Gammaproteobacteria bacterium]|nr:Nin-like protein [Gammaproteobacteria bacterium]